ncbi:MAG: large conductance mechanosensitive channel protein MscL [Dehalococcoidia bacterium]
MDTRALINEFKAFVMRGNVIELAVAVIIATAFKPIIDTLVDGVIMPIVAAIGGEPNFDSVKFNIGDGEILIGTFITAIISFLIVAAVVFFLVVKPMNLVLARMKKEEAADPPPPSEDIVLLREIRDALKR